MKWCGGPDLARGPCVWHLCDSTAFLSDTGNQGERRKKSWSHECPEEQKMTVSPRLIFLILDVVFLHSFGSIVSGMKSSIINEISHLSVPEWKVDGVTIRTGPPKVKRDSRRVLEVLIGGRWSRRCEVSKERLVHSWKSLSGQQRKLQWDSEELRPETQRVHPGGQMLQLPPVVLLALWTLGASKREKRRSRYYIYIYSIYIYIVYI